MENKDKNADLSGLSGERNVKPAPKYNLPTVQLNGNEGLFYEKIFSEEGSTKAEAGKEISGVMLKFRRKLSAFTKTHVTSTNEHNSSRDRVTVFETKLEGGKAVGTTMIDSGNSQEMKKKHNMKMTQVIFFMVKPSNKIIKLNIKGSGLSGLFEYYNEFPGSDEHTYQYISKINAILAEEKTPAGLDYYTLTFEKGERVEGEEFDLVAKNIREVAGKIQEIEDYYSSFESEEDRMAKTMNVQPGDIPIINEEEEIDVGDIDFGNKKEEEEKKKDEKPGTEKSV